MIRAPKNLLSAQVVKRNEKGRVVDVTSRVIFGTKKAIAAQLKQSPVSKHINTSYVERNNLTMRHQNRRLMRKSIAFSMMRERLEQQLPQVVVNCDQELVRHGDHSTFMPSSCFETIVFLQEVRGFYALRGMKVRRKSSGMRSQPKQNFASSARKISSDWRSGSLMMIVGGMGEGKKNLKFRVVMKRSAFRSGAH